MGNTKTKATPSIILMISFHTSKNTNKQRAAPDRVRQGRGCEDKSRVKGSMVGNQTGMRGTL